MQIKVGDWVRYKDQDGADQLAIVTKEGEENVFCVMTNQGAVYNNFILEVRHRRSHERGVEEVLC